MNLDRWPWVAGVVLGSCAAKGPPPVAPVNVELSEVALEARIAGERLTVARRGCAGAACSLELTKGVEARRARISAEPMVGSDGLVAVVLAQSYETDLTSGSNSRTFLVDPDAGARPALVCELPRSSEGWSCMGGHRTSVWATVERASPLRLRLLTASEGSLIESPTCACMEATAEGCKVTRSGPVTCADDAVKVVGREPGATGIVVSGTPAATVVAAPRGGGRQLVEITAEDGRALIAAAPGRYDVQIFTEVTIPAIEAEVVAGQTTSVEFDPRRCSCCPAP